MSTLRSRWAATLAAMVLAGCGHDDSAAEAGVPDAQVDASMDAALPREAGVDASAPPPDLASDLARAAEQDAAVEDASVVADATLGVDAAVEDCANGIDDDGDGLIDCRDPDCAAAAACADSCMPTTPFSLNMMLVHGDTTGRPAVHASSCSTSPGGSEQIFEFVAPQTGLAQISFGSMANLTVSLRTACEDDTSEIACASAFGSQFLLFNTTMGMTYFVMFDGVTPADAGPFFLEGFVIPHESSCNDFTDNDMDGYLDCDDPTDCQMLPACVPGAQPTGSACTANTDCTANHDDPICLDAGFYDMFPGNYCSEFCDVAAQDCAPGNLCAGGIVPSVNGVCLHSCTSDADCRIAYACTDAGYATKVCLLGPEVQCNDYLDNDFDGLLDCNDPTNCQQTPACTPGARAIGQPCTLNTDCFATRNDPICLDEANLGYLGGYCSHFCDPMLPTDCGPSGLCVPMAPDGENVCMQTCVNQAQCRFGYFCRDFGFPKKVCSF